MTESEGGGTVMPVGLSRRRTRIVLLLERLDTPVTVDQLVDELQRHREEAEDGLDEWGNLHERLYDRDLPALDRAGLLTFDENRGVVSRRVDDPHHLLDDSAESEEDDSSFLSRPDGYFLSLSAVSLAALVAAAGDIGPFGGLPDAVVAGGLVVAFVVLSLVIAIR